MSVAGAGAAAVTGRGAGGAAEIPSPNPSSASCASARSTSSACGPDALTRSVSPNRAPSATTFVRLVASHRTAVRSLGDSNVGVEAADGLDEPRRRPRVQADRVAHLEHGLRVRGWRGWSLVDRSDVRDAELRGLHRQRPPRLGRHLLERRATARRRRGRHRALDQRRLAQQHLARRLVEQLDRELGAHQRAPEVHQHQHAVVGHRPLDRRAHALGVGAEHAGLVSATGRFEREAGGGPSPAPAPRRPGPARRCGTRPRSRPRQPSEPVGAVQVVDRVHRLGPVAWVICQRQVSLSHATSPAPDACTCANRSAPTAIAMSYFSAFSPYVPAIPQQRAFPSVTSSPGISANSSSAGLPIQWPCCWQGAW